MPAFRVEEVIVLADVKDLIVILPLLVIEVIIDAIRIVVDTSELQIHEKIEPVGQLARCL
jgi:hypothetical protein